MESINIEATANSPKVILNYENGLIELDGKSYPENTFQFYEPIMAWLETYFGGKAKEETTINIKFTYFNSATSQILFDFFDVVSEGEAENLTVNWYYDDSKKNGLKDYEDYSDEFEDLDIQAIAFD